MTGNLSARLQMVLLLVSLAFAGCAHRTISELPAEQGMERIREDHKDNDWEKVITQVNEFKSRYPYSPLVSESDLLQADAYFQSAKYPEAVFSYTEFLKRNPNHPQASLASFRIAKTYDRQSPEEIDREQTFAQKAVENYSLFLRDYPKATEVQEATERLNVLRRRVAEHAMFIAGFYWKKNLFQGALTRYLSVLDKYTSFEDLQELASQRAAASYEEFAKQLETDPKSDLILFFRNETPASLRLKAAEILKKVSAKK